MAHLLVVDFPALVEQRSRDPRAVVAGKLEHLIHFYLGAKNWQRDGGREARLGAGKPVEDDAGEHTRRLAVVQRRDRE